MEEEEEETITGRQTDKQEHSNLTRPLLRSTSVQFTSLDHLCKQFYFLCCVLPGSAVFGRVMCHSSQLKGLKILGVIFIAIICRNQYFYSCHHHVPSSEKNISFSEKNLLLYFIEKSVKDWYSEQN